MELTYIQNGDYLIPDIQLTPMEKKPLGKYGSLRRTYLREHQPGRFSYLILSEKLFPHLWEVDEAANRMLDEMMPKLAKEAGATEELKAADPMKWVGLMNACKAQVEEIIYSELIYV